MKWHKGRNYPTFDGDGWDPTDWNKLKEPGPDWLNLIGIPVGLVAMAVTFYLWTLVFPELRNKEHWQDIFQGSTLMIILVLIILHEFIHMLVHPRMGRSPYSVFGFMPSHFIFFAAYTHEWSCRRFALCLLAPFFCISILPVALVALGLELPSFVIQASLINAFFSCGDIIGFALLVTQVPARARVRNQGFQSYWTP